MQNSGNVDLTHKMQNVEQFDLVKDDDEAMLDLIEMMFQDVENTPSGIPSTAINLGSNCNFEDVSEEICATMTTDTTHSTIVK